jgi:hypothetical protein
MSYRTQRTLVTSQHERFLLGVRSLPFEDKTVSQNLLDRECFVAVLKFTVN